MILDISLGETRDKMKVRRRTPSDNSAPLTHVGGAALVSLQHRRLHVSECPAETTVMRVHLVANSTE